MKNFYIAGTRKTNLGKYYAVVLKVGDCENIVSRLEAERLLYAHICPTKRKAEELADFWNESYKKNGSYAF